MTKTLKDANVGDKVSILGDVMRKYSSDGCVAVKLNNNHIIYYPSNIEVDNIIRDPWVPKVGDKYHYKSDPFNTYRIRGMEGNNWWIQNTYSHNFYTVTIVDASNIVQVKDE